MCQSSYWATCLQLLNARAGHIIVVLIIRQNEKSEIESDLFTILIKLDWSFHVSLICIWLPYASCLTLTIGSMMRSYIDTGHSQKTGFQPELPPLVLFLMASTTIVSTATITLEVSEKQVNTSLICWHKKFRSKYLRIPKVNEGV